MNKPRAFWHHGFWFMRLERQDGKPDLCTKCRYLENAWRDMQRLRKTYGV